MVYEPKKGEDIVPPAEGDYGDFGDSVDGTVGEPDSDENETGTRIKYVEMMWKSWL